MASMSTERALLPSSSSSFTHQWKYDVFLSFRGKDTRNNFTDHLYFALKQKGIFTLRDDEKLERGKSISPELSKAIEESRVAIVIFSRNYAFSTWCLDELAKVIGCVKETGMTVLPIFYNVDPSDIRKQIGTFAQAFAEHEECFGENIKKVQKWRDALREAGNLSGWHLKDRSEAECIQEIVQVILNKLRNTFSALTMGQTGIESRVEKLKSYLAIESNDVRIIGIWGTGGMGKTTLARVVYSMVSNHFEACCFIANVREESKRCGLCKLQKKLLKKLLMLENLNLQDVDDGVQMIKNRLHNKKILLVLDDINELDQLKKLAGEHCWFGSGSRIMITTRDRHLLVNHEVNEIYEAEVLNHDEALKLFSLKAFKKDNPAEYYEKLSQAFVDYCQGLPLALEVLGSFLFKKSIGEWKSELGRLTKFCDRGILNVLQISFDGLQASEKDIFLNIACFFNHKNGDGIKKFLDYLELDVEIGLRVLIDKSLIKLHENQLWMHDLLQVMGQDIVCQECKNPEERSRLWSFEDINNVLTENTGTKQIQCIGLEMHEQKNVDWSPEAFSNMRNLKLLKICGVQLMHDLKHLPNSLRVLHWRGYPSKSLTSSSQSKSFENLKFIELSESPKLIEVPGIIEVPNLESLVLEDCINLRRIHPSIGIHKKITILNLRGCKNLTSLPSKFEMECLTELNLVGCKNLTSLPSKFEMECLTYLFLSECSKIKKIPEFSRNMKRVRELSLRDTAITTLPTSIEHLTDLFYLDLRNCKNLAHLHDTIFNLKLITVVHLEGCSKLYRLPENLGNAESLKELYLSETAIRKVPSSIGLLKGLVSLKITILNLRRCKNLTSLPSKFEMECLEYLNLEGCKNLTSLPSKFEMECLTGLNLGGCSKIKKIPEFSRNMKRVRCLSLIDTAITTLPTSIEHLTDLYDLYLYDCKNLVHLPDAIFNLKSIRGVFLNGCSKLDRLPENLRNAESLCWLYLSGTAIGKVPSSIGLLKRLGSLKFRGCKGLSSNKSWYELLPSSLDYLHLEDCNLKAISNDIGSLFNLKELNLSGNDFVCLPESIIRLSKLEWMDLNNCTSLRSLPKLPLNVLGVEAEGCISLKMLPDPLKPSDSLEPSLDLQNCFQLANNQSCVDWFISGIKKSLKLSPSLPLSVLKENCNIVIPGSEIPEWFSHQSMGNEVKIKQPSHLCTKVGIAICIVFGTHDDYPDPYLSFSLIANGKRILRDDYPSITEVSSDHIWLVYVVPEFFDEEPNKLLWEGDVNGFSQIRIKIESNSVKVKKWGFRMIYKVKRSHDDYNGAGPSGEGGSNDIPNPKRIKRHTEAHGKSDCEESSEYKDCDEELSDWDESNDSDPYA